MSKSPCTYYRLLRLRQARPTFPKPLEKGSDEFQCINCGTRFIGNFCPQCGQKKTVHRVSLAAGIKDLIYASTKINGAFGRTVRELFYRPGHLALDYIRGHRAGYVSPLPLLFIASTLYILFMNMFGEPVTHNIKIDLDKSSATDMRQLVNLLEILTHNVTSEWLVGLTFLLPCVWLMYRKTEVGRTLNISELFYALSFFASQSIILSLLYSIVVLLFGGKVSLDDSSSCMTYALMAWDFRQFFRVSWKKSIFYTFLSGVLCFTLIVMIILVFLLFYGLVRHLN